MDLAAASAAFTGTDELMDDWPAEMITSFLPLTAGRDAVDGDVRVPLYSAFSCADSFELTVAVGACWLAELPLEAELAGALAELPLLQADTNASVSRVIAVAGPMRRPARRVIRVLLRGKRPISPAFFKRA
jgi:hypothetical protein